LSLARQLVQTNDPERLAALNLLGVALFEKPEKKPEDLKQAISYFEQMVQEDPGIAMAYTNWGAALSALGDKAGAVEKYRKAIELSPGEAMQHHNLGAVLADQGKDAEAVAAFSRAIELNPGEPDSYVGLASSQLKLGDAAASLATYQKAASLAPSDAGIQYSIGVAADQAGKPVDARQAFENYLTLSPDAPDKATVQGFIDALSKQ
jgi:tetratricopeptide (TPR) repeat protein